LVDRYHVIAKYMDMWNLRMLGNQIIEVEIANVGSSHGAYDFIY